MLQFAFHRAFWLREDWKEVRVHISPMIDTAFFNVEVGGRSQKCCIGRISNRYIHHFHLSEEEKCRILNSTSYTHSDIVLKGVKKLCPSNEKARLKRASKTIWLEVYRAA